MINMMTIWAAVAFFDLVDNGDNQLVTLGAKVAVIAMAAAVVPILLLRAVGLRNDRLFAAGVLWAAVVTLVGLVPTAGAYLNLGPFGLPMAFAAAQVVYGLDVVVLAIGARRRTT
jgi:hypothetical protein